jgi:hypothetical protein
MLPYRKKSWVRVLLIFRTLLKRLKKFTCKGNGFVQNHILVEFSSKKTNEARIFREITILWRPMFIIVQSVIVLWRELNYVKIPQSDANKSANLWGILRGKVSSQSLTSLARVRIKYTSSTRLRCLFLLETIPY